MASTVMAAIPTGERPGRGASEALAQRRVGVESLPVDPGPGVEVTEEVHGGVHCVIVAVPEPESTVLYLHGGGYRLCSARFYSTFAGRLARATRSRVVVPDYRLAPEHPFPAALRDAAAVHDALAGDPAREGVLVVSGDSAGGGLAAAVTAVAGATEAPRADALVLMSPWLDLRCSSPTYASRADTETMFARAAAEEAAELYLQGHPADDPLASPLFAVSSTFPPTYLLASSDETLLGDTVEMGTRLIEARVPVVLDIRPGVAHSWPVTTPDDPAGEHAITAIAGFLRGLGPRS